MMVDDFPKKVLFLVLVLSRVTVSSTGSCCEGLDAACVACAANITVPQACLKISPWLAGCPAQDDCNNQLTGSPCDASQQCYDWTGEIDGIYECQCVGGLVGHMASGNAKCFLNPCDTQTCSSFNATCTLDWVNGRPTALCSSLYQPCYRSADTPWPLNAPQPIPSSWTGPLDSCNTCSCSNGVLTCTSKTCPPPDRLLCSNNTDCTEDGYSCNGSFCTPLLYNCKTPATEGWTQAKKDWCCKNGTCTPANPCARDKLSSECVPKGCCTASGVASCAACMANVTIEHFCRDNPSTKGCPLCAGCKGNCSITEEEGVIQTNCTNSTMQCEKQTSLDECVGPCQWHLSNQVCVDAKTFCSGCEIGCESNGKYIACAAYNAWSECPVERSCFGVNPSNMNDRFCCPDGQYCSTEWHKGGEFGVFGGVCIPHYDPCQQHTCSAGDTCVTESGKPSCKRTVPEFAFDCPPGQRSMPSYSGRNINHTCTPIFPSNPCKDQCADGYTCTVSVKDNHRVAACRKDSFNAKCNTIRANQGLPVCTYECEVLYEDNTRCIEIDGVDKCKDTLVWPPLGVQGCTIDADCRTGEYCTGFTPIPLCNASCGSVTEYLRNGFRSCEPARFTCSMDTRALWTTEETNYCCGMMEIGCSAYNCLEGDPDNWHQEKAAYCCSRVGLGCLVGFDCTSRRPYSEWSFKKRVHCCNEGVGCPAPRYSCEGDEAAWKQEEKDACCTLKGKGCPAGGFKCNEGITEPANKEWCCRTQQLLCEAVETYQCNEQYKEKWNAEERKWCCYNRAIGCEVLRGWACFESDRTKWSLGQQQWCCDTYGMGCGGQFDALYCSQDILQWSKDKNETCCTIHGMGCPVACELPSDHLNHDQQQYCCDTLGSHCQQQTGSSVSLPSTPRGSSRVLILLKSNWVQVRSKPKIFVWKLRATIAAINAELISRFETIQIRKVYYTSSGGKPLEYASLQQEWEKSQNEAWGGSKEKQSAVLVAPKNRKSTGLASTVSGYYTSAQDVIGVELDIPSEHFSSLSYYMSQAEEQRGVLAGGRQGTGMVIVPVRGWGRIVDSSTKSPEGTHEHSGHDEDDSDRAQYSVGLLAVPVVLACLVLSMLVILVYYRKYFSNDTIVTMNTFRDLEKNQEKGHNYIPPLVVTANPDEVTTHSFSYAESSNLHNTFNGGVHEECGAGEPKNPLKLENLKLLQAELAESEAARQFGDEYNLSVLPTPLPFR